MWHFAGIFLKENAYLLMYILLMSVLSSHLTISIGSGNGMATKRQKPITWISGDPLHMHHLAHCPIIAGSRIQYVNSLWPSSDVIWWQGSEPTLVQVMVCCLTAWSHYLNQCWLPINEVLWHSPESNFTASAQATIRYYECKKYTFKITVASPRVTELRAHKCMLVETRGQALSLQYTRM